MTSVFIDGEAGTTGLQIRERLSAIPEIKVRRIADDKRKDRTARAEMMRAVDLAVLCLPDDAAREAVEIANELGADAPRIIDASTAHRIDNDWVYGFAELDRNQADAIRNAKRVANPGCYPTGAIALIRPLVNSGVMPADYPVTVNAVSGYTGGGKAMIADYEAGTAAPFVEYGLGLHHKHVPELMRYAGLVTRPIFVPSVASFAQGMLVSVPLHLDTLAGEPTLNELRTCLEQHYANAKCARVASEGDVADLGGRITAEDLNDTDAMELFVFGDDDLRQAVLVARLDNLGKGASGAAVQNIRLMLGVGN